MSFLNYKAYENYKDSGIDWIGEIPKDWSICRVKNKFSIRSGDSPVKKEEGKYEIIGANGCIGLTDDFNITKKHITIGRVGAAGSVNITPDKAFVSDNALILDFNESIVFDYAFYLLKALNLDSLINKNAQPLITATQVKNLFIMNVSKQEQSKIASYLDEKTSKIDNIISKNKELISLLEEEKLAIIHQVVTKGLDFNVPVKDSGIEWIGEIPSHWDLHKLKRFVTLHNGKQINNEVYSDDEGAINVYGSGGVFKFTDEYMFNGEAVLFGRKGTIGKPIYLNEKFWAVDTVYYLTCNDLLVPKFCYYSLILYPWDKITTSTAKPSVVGSDVTNSTFHIPPKKDQISIVNFLDNEILNLNNIIKKIDYQISLLEEYKNSLIHQVVTGKIDVRGEI